MSAASAPFLESGRPLSGALKRKEELILEIEVTEEMLDAWSSGI
jgi:hypothetical protein